MNQHHRYIETDRLGGYDPYSASKACRNYYNSYRNSFFNTKNYSTHKKSIASTRAGNVIGGGDWAKDRIIPDIIKALQENKIITVRNPNAIRPWQHVLEPLGGYLHLGTKMVDEPVKYSDAWNFGPNIEDDLTVEELVNLAIKYWGAVTYEKPSLSNQPHEAGLLKLDITKAKNEFGNSNLIANKLLNGQLIGIKNQNRKFLIFQLSKYQITRQHEYNYFINRNYRLFG